MALAHWAKSNVGTNLSFVKGVSKVLKSWRDLVEQAILRKVPKSQPKRVGEFEADTPKNGHYRYVSQTHSRSRISDSLQSRIFKAIVSRTASKSYAKDLLVRSGLTGGRSFRNVPIFCLVGVTLGVDVTTLLDKSGETLVSDVRGMFEHYSWETEPLENPPKCLNDLDIETDSIANGCEGVVYKAKVKDDSGYEMEGNFEHNLAVKAVFNYSAESNSHSILREMQREMVPLQVSASMFNADDDTISKQDSSLPPHPNIVEMPGVFVDDMLVTEEGRSKYPAALPRRLNREQFFGRNKTLYLVMKRRSSNLREFLFDKDISMMTRCLLLAQLLEGVSHLQRHGISHRDLKTDNLLVDLPSNGEGNPRLEICDFGCCLAQANKSLCLPYPSHDLFIGGNCWLMAPEICTAVPGPNAILDFSKSDVWAVGAIAYEILGGHNPFYPCKDNLHTQLKSATYSEEDLPPLPDDVPDPIKKLVQSLLVRDPAKRPSPNVAATVVQIVVLEDRNRDELVEMKNYRKIGRSKGTGVHRNRKKQMPLSIEAQKFQLILQSSLILLSRLTFGKQLKCVDMDSVMEFEFLSKLTYSDFKMAMKFF